MHAADFSAVLAAIEVRRAQILHQILERRHGLAIGKVAGNGGNLVSGAALERFSDSVKRFGPIRFFQFAILAHIAAVQAALLQAIAGNAGLVGDPFFVHVFVEARHDAHHFAAACIDANDGAARVMHVDALGLA